MLVLTEIVVHFDPRSAVLSVAAPVARAIELKDRAADRVIDSLFLLLDALALPARPSRIRFELEPPRVSLRLASGERVLTADELARLPALALSGPIAVARREAGDIDADVEKAAGALAGEASFWGALYREQDIGWDLGQAAPPLMRLFGTMKPCRAVVVGCGQGHEVRALAKLGFDVVGVDFVPEALDRARRLTAEAGLRATFAQADVLTLPGALGPFDLWVEHTCFCAIDPARRLDYVAAAARTLAPRGEMAALFYAHGRPGGPPYSTTEAEIRTRFEPFFDLVSLQVAPDSVERRRGEELLGHFRRRS